MMKTVLPGSVALLLLTVLLAACGQQPETTQARLRAVKTMTVGTTDTERSRTFSGVSKSSLETRLSFKVAGSVEEVPVAVGDTLKAGQLIARLDDSVYDLQAQQAQADHARARAEERNASANYERVRGLYENSNASRNELDTARAGFESAKAQLTAARRALELARLSIAYSELKAAEDCSVASIAVAVGENVAIGQQVAMVACGDGIEVELFVPEGYVSQLRAGQPATVMFDAVPERSFTGTVIEVGVAAAGGSTYPVTVSIDERRDDLRSGMAAQVRFDLPVQASAAYTIPPVAVGEDRDGRFVYLVTAGERPGVSIVRRQAVTTGELTSDGMEILSGLSSGDRVVTAGLSVVRDGLEVMAD